MRHPRMRLVVFLVTVTLVIGQNDESCPFQCNCSDKTVICKGLSQFPIGIPPDVQSLVFDVSSFVDFAQNSLKTFKSLKTFRIINSNFTYIHSCSIANLDNLTRLEFSNVRIEEITTNGISHISNIKDIVLNKVIIQKVKEYAFNDLTNVDNIVMQNVVFGNLNNYAFSGWSNVRMVKMDSVMVLLMDPYPFRNFGFVDQFEITNGTFPTSLCGLKGIIRTDTVKKFKLLYNKIVCSCDSTWISEVKRNSKDFEVLNNTCIESSQDVGKLDTAKQCSSSETPECTGSIAIKYKVQDCRTYKMDEPIIPLDPVHYPEKEKAHNNGFSGVTSSISSVMTLIIFAFVSITN